MSRSRSIQPAAFTLVELLVVIGIIAILIGVLLPVLSGVAARGRDLQCQSNIRQCVQLILAYASENKGQLPFGYYYARGGAPPEGWGPFISDYRTVTIWSVVSHMSSKTHALEDLNFYFADAQPHEAARNAATFLRCPEATQVMPHLVSYIGNLAAFIVPVEDAELGAMRNGPPWQRLVERQTTLTRCFPWTALVWDTAVTPGMATKVGYVVGFDLDDQRIWFGAVRPQYRYFSTHDPFARIGPGTYGNNKSIQMRVWNWTWRNIDPPAQRFDHFNGMALNPYAGNLRFRHERNTSCNVGFVDGHVGKFRGKFTPDGSVVSHDAIRKHFMVKWPSGIGIAPDPGQPH
jgi:prepilin-type N-terminal cleavage/methylation domain-containing protein/prepilin-type processing-associated H-X9-DG protein